MNSAYLEIKSEHKSLAQKIRELKNQRKEENGGYVSGLDRARIEFRHRHIAFCEILGRTRDQIEKPNSKAANENYIEKIKAEYIQRLEEASKENVEA